MATGRQFIQRKIILELSEEEALFLKGLTQNYMIPTGPNDISQEDSQSTELRENIFNALQEAFKSEGQTTTCQETSRADDDVFS